MRLRFKTVTVAAVFALSSIVAFGGPSTTHATGARYATDAYPGFDLEENLLKPSKKEPRWFAFITGPKKEDPVAQFAWCEECEKNEDWSAARKGYDALVREWPTSPLAPRAQLRLAELEVQDRSFEDAFAEYRYLLDFFSSSCDYNEVAKRMYALAEQLRADGKNFIFFHFANTVDVRRAYEALVLRAPGADFVPKAMLTIASLRIDEGKFQEAVTVFENLRNLHPNTPEAAESVVREARIRMKMLDEMGYNRSRVRDTIDFLRLSLRGDLEQSVREELDAALAKARDMYEAEAWKAAAFYDSRTRTRRSAINAYEVYLKEYPEGPHAEEARTRRDALLEGGK